MLIKNNNASRRRVLRGMLNGAAVTVAVPFLSMELNDNGNAFAATGQPLPSRFGTWFWGLGCDQSIFYPKTVGKLGQLPQQIASLEKVKQYVNVFTNFTVLTDGKPNSGHFTGWAALRTGSVPANRSTMDASLDEPIANVISGGTRFRGIYLAASGGVNDSYSFQSADAVNQADNSAVEFYRKVFGADFQDPNSPDFKPDPKIMTRKSVLSAVTEQRKDLEKVLGAADKARLDQHYTSIRELEGRLALQLQKPPPAPTCKVPEEPKEVAGSGANSETVAARHTAMTDIMALALACNQTKIFNMMYSVSQASTRRPGWDKGHHAVTHEEPKDPVLGYQPMSSWYVGEAIRNFSYFLERLAATPEGDGNLLDHSVVFAHTDCFLAQAHSIDKIPMFTAGTLHGKIKAGLHIDGQGQVGSKVGLTLQRLMGVPVDTWGTGSMKVSQDVSEMLA